VDASALIRQDRSRAGLTQAQLARAAGTSQSTIAAYESGAKSPSVRTLDRIVRAADDRLQRAESVGDEVGVQIAFESILRNLFIIGEDVKAIPTEVWTRVSAARK